ncbi:MAG TPA: phosphoglycerate dehydrogenase [Clostridiaceae bacterium]|nr:phosphoglycerate dehydrogenase [Clostridiaceae bacterium]
MYKVLVTSRSFGQKSHLPIEVLEKADIEVTHMGQDFNLERFETEVKDYDALIIGAHPFRTEVMRGCQKLEIVAKHGAGVDNIDLVTAREMGILVTNVPAMNANAVADLAFGHILNLSRGISIADKRVHKGEWKPYTGRDVFGKTLGLVGFGAIAKNVARRAKGFSMKVYAYDPFQESVPEEFRDFVSLVDFDTLLAESDVISIHVPLTAETNGLFDYDTICRMKKESILVNTGRGGIISEEDLYQALVEGRILGAALDVTEKEPIDSGNPLLTLENVVITPHIGMYSLEAINAVGMICAENVVRGLKGEELEFRVV